MFFSSKYSLLFIASPKTGTVSVHEALEKLDPKGERRKIVINGNVVTGKQVHQGIIGHARARELKKAMGPSAYNALNTMAFVRNPYAKLVSSYFFNKKQKLLQSFYLKGNKKLIKRSLFHFVSVLITKFLPFKIWALIYPYKTNISYVTDYDGTRIVRYLGRTEFLDRDFKYIMEQIGIPADHIQVGKKNTSTHKSHEHYFKAKWFKRLIYKKMKDDIDLYEKVCSEME